MTNRPEFLEALFAVWHAGLVAVPMNAKLHSDEFGYIIGNTAAALTLASPDRADDVAPHGRTIATGTSEWRKLCAGDGIDIVPRRADDLAWLFYTSGTTGRPKGAMLTHGIMMAQTLAYFAEIEPVGPGDCVLHAAPMSHGSGCYGLPARRDGRQDRRSGKRRLRAGGDRRAARRFTAMSVSSQRPPWSAA